MSRQIEAKRINIELKWAARWLQARWHERATHGKKKTPTREVARGPRAEWHDRATLVVAVLSCFGIVIRQFSFYLSSPCRIRRFLGFLGLSFCIVIELKIQERIDW